MLNVGKVSEQFSKSEKSMENEENQWNKMFRWSLESCEAVTSSPVFGLENEENGLWECIIFLFS